MNCLKIVSALMFATIATLGCSAPVPTTASKRAELRGDSELVGYFREAEAVHGVPAELLATIAWLQSRLSGSSDPHPGHHHGYREWGVMAIGTGGKTRLETAAARINRSPLEVATDPRTNILAAAALLADRADRQPELPRSYADWAPALAWYGGDALTEAVLRLQRTGWTGWDDQEAEVQVLGTGLKESQEVATEPGLGVVQQELGFPGAKWSSASSSNYSNANRGSGDIKYVVIHTVQGSYAGAISWFKNPAANVSAHYVVRSNDGAVTQMVDDRDIAWHDGCFNTHSIGIEHEGYVQQPHKWYTDKMYRSSARLVSWLCDKYNIPKSRSRILGHSETPDCSDHTDPGSGWNWGKYMKLIKSGGKIATLKAKLTKKWSNAKRHHGKKAHYQVCAGDSFKMAFTFKNVGSATWRDVHGRGNKVGSDVYLVTANGKKDRLTGKKRFSLRKNKNRSVRGDRKAKNCSNKNGCRRTTFTRTGLRATAPKKPGIYRSRWRLRDYSKYWGKKSHGFGPKVELKIKVKKCAPKNCSCTITCDNGVTHQVATPCGGAGTPSCLSVKDPCSNSSGFGGVAGVSNGSSAGGQTAGGTPTSAGGAAGLAGTTDDPEPPAAGSAEAEIPDDDSGAFVFDDADVDADALLPVADDADFIDDGFNGDEPQSTSAEARGCALGRPSARSLGAPFVAFGLLAMVLAGRRRAKRRAAG